MKPQDNQARRKQSNQTAKVRRLILRDLGWVGGAPLGWGREQSGALRWLVLRRGEAWVGETITVDAALVRRARNRIKSLQRNSPKILGRLIGKTRDWEQRHLALLDEIDQALANRRLPDPCRYEFPAPKGLHRRAEAIVTAQPELRPLVSALVWTSVTHPKVAQRPFVVLKSIAPRLAPFAEIQVGKLSTLLQLACLVGAARLEPVLEWARHPGAENHCGEIEPSVVGHLSRTLNRDHRRRSRKASKPPLRASDRTILLRWCLGLTRLSKARARRSLELFSDCYPAFLLRPWKRWWERWEKLETDALLVASTRDSKPIRQQEELLLKAVQRHARRSPKPILLEELFRGIWEIQHERRKRRSFLVPLHRSLRSLPRRTGRRQEYPCRAAFLIHWGKVYLRLTSEEEKRFQTVLGGFERFVREMKPECPGDFGPWAGCIETPGIYFSREENLASELKEPGLIEAYFRELTNLARAEHPSFLGDCPYLANFLLADPRPGRACEIWQQTRDMGRSGTWVLPETLQAAIELGDGDFKETIEPVEKIQNLVDNAGAGKTAVALLLFLKAKKRPELVAHLLGEKTSAEHHPAGSRRSFSQEAPGSTQGAPLPARLVTDLPQSPTPPDPRNQ